MDYFKNEFKFILDFKTLYLGYFRKTRKILAWIKFLKTCPCEVFKKCNDIDFSV